MKAKRSRMLAALRSPPEWIPNSLGRAGSPNSHAKLELYQLVHLRRQPTVEAQHHHVLAWYVGPVVIAVVTLALLLSAGMTLRSDMPFYGFEIAGVGAHVKHVEVNGPAFRSGLRPSDQIVALDGVPLFAHFRLPRASQPDGIRTLTYQRGAHTYSAVIEPARLSPRERAFNVVRLFIGSMFFLVGIAVWALRPGNRVRRLFFLTGQLLAAVLFLDILDPTVVPAVLASDTLNLFLGAMVIHFAAIFPHPIDERIQKVILFLGYGGAAVLAAVSLVVAPLSSSVAASALLPSMCETFVLIAVSGGLVLLVVPHRDVSLDVQRRRRVIVAGMFLGIAPLLILTQLSFLLTNVPLLDYEYTIPFLALVPLTYGYAFLKGGLGTTDFILNRTLVYLILTTFLVVAYTLLVYSMGHAYPLGESPAYFITIAGLLVLSGVLFAPARARLQRAIDRLFYKGWYDYRTVVRQVSDALNHTTDRTQLIARLEMVARTMRFESAAVLWMAGDRLKAVSAYGPTMAGWENLDLEASGDVAGALLRENRLFEGVVTRQDDGSTVLKTVATPGLSSYWLPLVYDDALQGILVMANRQADEVLRSEDTDILQILAQQAAIATANTRLVEDLQVRLVEVEHARDALTEAQQRLAEAREAERAHLARELHDGPVQDLHAVGHQLEAIGGSIDNEGAEALRKLYGMVHESAERLRGICMELRPPFLKELGYKTAIRAYTSEFARRHRDLHVDLRVVAGAERLPPPVELALFRICQESLNNAVSHGQARCITIAFHADAHRARLVIEDDGCGFSVPERWTDFGRRGRLGLMGMAERVEVLGGQFEVDSRRGEGTTIRTTIPLSPHTSEGQAIRAESTAF